MPDTELAEELLQIEEADAWFEYLEATRAQSETRYGEVEPWAWARLESASPCCSRPSCAAPAGSRLRQDRGSGRRAARAP